MKDVAFLREAEPRVRFIRQLLEDPPRDSASIAGDSTELRQNHRTSCHHRIQDSHFVQLTEPPAFIQRPEDSKLFKTSIKEEILSPVSIVEKGREFFDSAEGESRGLIGLVARRVHCVVVRAF